MMKACCEKAIPVVEEPLRYERADFVASELIEITDCKKLAVQMQYPLLGMRHAESRCLVRKEVYEKLIVAAGLLPKGYRLCIWDAWRPFALQQELLEQYTGDIIREFRLEEATEEERKAVISQFVAEPVEDRLVPPVHTTGGAVDVTILDTYGQPLNMGTDFDAFTDKTHTAFLKADRRRKSGIIADCCIMPWWVPDLPACPLNGGIMIMGTGYGRIIQENLQYIKEYLLGRKMCEHTVIRSFYI